MTSRTRFIMFHVLCILIGIVGVVCGQTDCDHELTASTIPDTLTSPNFPSNYPNDLRCVIHIRSPPGSRIELNFTTFELEDSDSCAHDSLVIDDGIDGGDRLLLHSCGTTSSAWIWPRFPDGLIETTGSEATIVFVTDSSVSARGFSFEYRYIQTRPEALFFTDQTRIRYIYRRNAVYGYFSENSMMNVSAVDFDPGSGFLFYGDSGARQISRWKVVGSTPSVSEVIVIDVDPFGFCLDIPSRLLYWTDAALRTVSVTDLDGTHRSTIIRYLEQPGAIVVEPYKEYIYYTDIGTPATLERADGDGGNRVILAQGLGQGLDAAPTALAIDLTDRVLYWIDSSVGRLHSVRYDGSGFRFLSSAYGGDYPFALVIDSDAFIFTDPIRGRLRFDSRDLTAQGPWLAFSSGTFHYKGLTLRPTSSTGAEPNACPNSACQVSELCLPKPNGQHRCDTGIPTVDCPVDIEVTFMEGESPPVQVSWTEPVDTVVRQSHHPSDYFPEGVTTVTYTFSKDGEILNCSFTVTVIERDTTPPVFLNCPESITAWIAPGTTSKLVTWDTIILEDPSDVIRSTVEPGSEFYIGTEMVIVEAWDSSSNRAWCNFTVTVRVDSIPPEISHCPPDLTVTVTTPSDAGTAVDWIEPALTDNSGVAYWSGSPPSSGSLFPIGSTMLTYTGTDTFGNMASCSFYVTVNVVNQGDTTPPVFLNCPDPITAWIAPGTTSKLITWHTINLENPSDVIRSSLEPGSEFYIGTEMVIIEAWDSSSNIAWCNFTVTVQVDDIPPEIDHCPSDLTVTVTTSSGAGTAVDWIEPALTDNSGDAYWLDSPPSPGSLFPIGSTMLTYTGIDTFGNMASCSFYVTVDLVNQGDNNLALTIGVGGGVSVVFVIVIIVAVVLIVPHCRGADRQAAATDPGIRIRNPGFTQEEGGVYTTHVYPDDPPPYIDPTWDCQYGTDNNSDRPASVHSVEHIYEPSPTMPHIYALPKTQAKE